MSLPAGPSEPSAEDALDGYLKTLSVLLAEDDPLVQSELGEFLGRRVAEVRTAGNGEEALGAFLAQPPSILVTDIRMPGMDGLALARAVRSSHPDTPIILSTAFEQSAYLLEAIGLGVEGYVIKPVSGPRLLKALRTCAGRLMFRDLVRRSEAAVRAKSFFLANVSHEIRTPLNAVLGMAELLARTELGPRQRGYVQMILQSGNDLLSLLNDVLDASKLEAGQLRLESALFDLEELVYGTVERFHALAQRRPVEFLVDFRHRGPARLVGDPGRLGQILNNLVSNAAKFTGRGHVLVRVESAPLADGLVRVHLTVEDTGVGIPAERVGELFQPFVQGDPSTARKYGGSGLGLAIIRQLSEAMGGSVTVESLPGRGSTFRVEVLLGLPPAGEAPVGDPSRPLEGLRVLLVDDVPVSLALLDRQLTSRGLATSRARDGLEALSLMRKAQEAGQPFAAVLTDLQMPGMDGAGLGRIIRADRDLDGLALIALTHTARDRDAAQLETIGFDGYFVKPVRDAQLLQALAAALEARGGGRSSGFLTRTALPGGAQEAPEAGPRLEARILLVEDHRVNRTIARGILEETGAEVVAAADGAEALAIFSRSAFDLVLMDCQMPVLDGFEATRRIRALEAGTGQHVPILAMTAHAMEGDREACLDAGMDDYLTKPIRRESLLQAVRRWLPDAVAPAGPEAGALGAPPPLPGLEAVLDLPAALQRFGGDASRLKETLRSLLEEGDPAARVRAHLERGDREIALREAHTLKGLAGLVEARALAEAAGELEHRLRARGAGAGEALETLDGACRAFYTVLREGMDEAGPGAPPAEGLSRLDNLLSREDFDALACIGDLLQAGPEPRLRAVLEGLGDLVSHMAFREARVRIRPFLPAGPGPGRAA